MGRPKGIKETRHRNNTWIAGEAAWKRLWVNNHYREKGISLADFKCIVTQNCHYCGDPPPLVNPYGRVYVPESIGGSTEKWWNDQWICAHGIDKIVPCDDYKDLKNLVPCCKMCNWLKGVFGRDIFLAHIAKIYFHSCQSKFNL